MKINLKANTEDKQKIILKITSYQMLQRIIKSKNQEELIKIAIRQQKRVIFMINRNKIPLYSLKYDKVKKVKLLVRKI